MSDQEPDSEEIVKELDQLQEEIDKLRQRITAARDEDRRRVQLPFAWPDRRRRAA